MNRSLQRLADEIMREHLPAGTQVIRNSVGGVECHTGGLVGKLWRIQDPNNTHLDPKNKLGLKGGDLVLCVGHSGDCFQDYVHIIETEKEWSLIGDPSRSFGSYGIGDAIEAVEYGDLPEWAFFMLRAGGVVNFE